MKDNLQVAEIKNPIEPIDLKIFKEHTKKSFLAILDQIPQGEKTLVLEKSCIQKLNYLSDLDLLKSKGIRSELLVLRDDPYVIETKIIIYVIPNAVEYLVKIKEI